MKISTCSDRTILEPCGLRNLDYQVDPYIGCEHHCHYCYALNRAETDWREEIQVHRDISGRLEKELEGIPPQKIYLGYHTDPYQPCEAESGQTRKVLELLLKKGFSASILTKSDLVVRDMDVLGEMEGASVSVSVAFNDDRTRGLFEARTMETERRIQALARLKEAGIGTGALLCPVIPHITDPFPLIEALAPHIDLVWIYGLSILDRSDKSWRNVEGILDDNFPDLKERIEEVIFSKDHPYWARLREELNQLQKERQVSLSIHL